MLTALLPNSSAPSSRSLCSSRRLTMPARLLPCFSSRAMLARDDAVSAVSLPAKNADSSSNTNTVTIASQSWASISLDSDPLSLNQRDRLSSSRVKFIGEEGAHLGRTDVILDEGLADAAHQDKRELAALNFLVLCDQVHQRVDTRHAAGDILEISGQANRGKMSARPRGVRFAYQALAGGEFERQRRAERNRLAVQQPAGEAGAGLQRVTEGVAEIEQRALAGFALVARHDAGLAAAADRDGVLAPCYLQKCPASWLPARRRTRHRRASRIWPSRHSRRGIR